MVRRVKAPTRNPFLATDGVATRLAIRELKKAKVDPVPLLAKAGMERSRSGQKAKFGSWRSQQRRSVTRRWAFTLLSTLIFASVECSITSWLLLQIWEKPSATWPAISQFPMRAFASVFSKGQTVRFSPLIIRSRGTPTGCLRSMATQSWYGHAGN
jgi:hypothetical protein